MKIPKKSAGFTLLEILITTFIFSFAMLSLALMQMNGMKHGHSASLQSAANMQAMDILERMRANRVDVLAEKYDIAKMSTPSEGSGIAADEIISWRSELKRLLPEGTGSIDCSVTGFCDVNIFWNSIIPSETPLEPDELTLSIASQL